MPETTIRASALELVHISKSFGEMLALRDVSISFEAGEVHAIVGENGAGKSTLINIASGNLLPSEGRLRISGLAMSSQTPRALREAGVSVVFQHPALLTDLSILENLLLVAPGLTREDARALLARVSPRRQFDLSMRVQALSIAEMHVLEIARALASEPKIIFFDEPTEPFQREEVDELFELIEELAASGVAVVYVSHRLHEVYRVAGRISIMRDGALIATRLASEISHDEVVTLIVGRALDQVFPQKCATTGRKTVEVAALCGDGFNTLSFHIRAGEILGFAGVEGEGQREAIRAIAGLGEVSGGDILLNGKNVETSHVKAASEAGIRFVPDDRHREGLFMNLSVRENLSAGRLAGISRFGFVRPLWELEEAGSLAYGSQIKTPSVEAAVAALSGGNQQKVVIARALADQPQLLLIDEPTKGVDVGARSAIYQRIRTLAREGMAVIVLSSDSVELEGLCDRVLVFSRGSVAAELSGGDVTERQIAQANLTATGNRALSDGGERRWWHRAADADIAPLTVLLPLILMIVISTQYVSPHFLSPFSIASMLSLLTVLALVSAGQLLTVLAGGVDISVGALAGLCVVLASFVLPDGAGGASLAGGVAVILVICTVYGLIQGWLVSYMHLPAIVVTLATFLGLQGISLALRPEPAGMISYDLNQAAITPLLGMPIAFVLTLALVLALEFVVARTNAGRALRASGSNANFANRLGLRPAVYVVAAFAACGLLTGLGGILLALQVGMGSAVTGVDLSIMSVTAVMVGGASVTGGRGSMLATFGGTVLVQLISSASAFLYSDSAIHNIELGLVTIGAAVMFSVLRR